MFKVVGNNQSFFHVGEIFTVFQINEIGDVLFFLIYNNKKWQWVEADNFSPYEELD